MAGTRANIPNYDVSFKLSICEEYLEWQKNNPSLTKKDYASSKGIKYNTFLDWIRTYKNYQDNKHNNVIPISGTVDNKVPKLEPSNIVVGKKITDTFLKTKFSV